MSNDVVAFDPSVFDASMRNMAAAGAPMIKFLKMDRAGNWVYGQDETPVDSGERAYVDPNGFVHGWQCWADTALRMPNGQPVKAALLGDIKVPSHEPIPPMPDDVPINGREWSKLAGMSLYMHGEKLVFTTTSLGGRNAIAGLAPLFRAQYAKNPKRMIPVVQLGCDSYKHPSYNRVFVPVLNVVDWVDHVPTDSIAEEPVKAEVPAKDGPKVLPKAPKVAAKDKTVKAARKAV